MYLKASLSFPVTIHQVTGSPDHLFQTTKVEQLPALTPAPAVSSHTTHQQPDSRPAESAPALLSAPSYSHHGEVFHVQQARLDLVCSMAAGDHMFRAKCAVAKDRQCLYFGEQSAACTTLSWKPWSLLLVVCPLGSQAGPDEAHGKHDFICSSQLVSREGSRVLRKEQGQ